MESGTRISKTLQHKISKRSKVFMVKKILISQPAPTTEKSPYFDIAAKHGVEFVFHPFIKVECLTPKEFRQQKIQVLDYSAIVFTSRHAIDNFFTLCKEMRVAIPETMKYFAISETVSYYIQKYVQYRKRKVFCGATGKLADLVAMMVKHKNEKYLVPQSDVAGDEVHRLLEEKKLNHTECIMYRTVRNDYPQDKPFNFDMIVLFTPAGVESLQKNFPDFVQGDTRLACFGKSTAKALGEAGFRLDLEAPTVEARSMTAAIDLYLDKVNK